MLYHKIFSILKEIIEQNFTELLFSETSFINRIKNELSVTFENKIDFKVGVLSLHDRLEEDYIEVFGSLNLILIELLSILPESNLKYFGIVYDCDTTLIRQESYKPILFYFLSETVNENKANFCKIHDFETPILDRYNVDMQNTEEGFIVRVVDCMECIEIVNQNYTKIDEYGNEIKYIGCGFRYAYDGFVLETIELDSI
ncbi:MAG: hypothetical protein KIT33_10405 [Candidatus Kapabacteria bacterium]|nr:hypothetical protein [Ignavibacteriota bacterium]MCW5885370.1 hypothetical protein [Candidatus Kapabacteria bacterium]